MPPPEPRSRTVSPALRSATAVGLPQPSDAMHGLVGQLVALAVGVERGAEDVALLVGDDGGVGCRSSRASFWPVLRAAAA